MPDPPSLTMWPRLTSPLIPLGLHIPPTWCEEKGASLLGYSFCKFLTPVKMRTLAKHKSRGARPVLLRTIKVMKIKD